MLDPSSDAALLLADAVLGDERVRLAEQIREGGPHAMRRAIELASLVLAAAETSAAKGGAGA